MKQYKLIRNKKAQQIFISMMVAVMVLILVVILSNPLKTEITKATNGTFSSNLNSSDPSISAESKATILVLDLGIFYFIAILIASSIAFISGRKSFVGVITSIMIFMIVSVLITPLKSLIILARDASHLNCASATLSVGGRLACIITDIWLFYFVITVIASAVTYIFITKVIPKK